MPEWAEVAHFTKFCCEYLNVSFNDTVHGSKPQPLTHKTSLLKIEGDLKNGESLTKMLPLEIKSIENFGKKMFMTLENKSQLIFSFGMDGYVTFDEKNQFNKNKLTFEEKSNSEVLKILFYGWIRGFSCSIEFCDASDYTMYKKLDVYRIPEEKFLSVLKSSKQIVANLLKDQKKLTGIGNYLRAEIIYDAEVEWNSSANKLTKDESKRLYKSTKKIIKDAFVKGGLTIKDFKLNGKKGRYEPLIYGRQSTRDKKLPVTIIDGTQKLYVVKKS